MPTSLSKYLDPTGLDETVVNIRQLTEALEAEMQELPYARPDGLYPDMTVGAVIGADETAQWATRESTGSGSAIVRSVQGAAVAWNQLVKIVAGQQTSSGVTITKRADGTVTVSGAAASNVYFQLADANYIPPLVTGNKYLVRGTQQGTSVAIHIPGNTGFNTAYDSQIITAISSGTAMSNIYVMVTAGFDGELTFKPQIFDLTALYGAGNEPTTVTEFEQTYPEAYYPYSAPTLKPVQIAGIRSTTAQGNALDSMEWTAQTLRAAGSVRDELTATELVTRVGSRAYQSGDESDSSVITDGTTTFYELATPTTTPISPALPMTYKVQQGGTESIIVPDDEVSAAPVLTVAEPVNMSTEFARIWAAIEQLQSRGTAQLSRTDTVSIDEVQKDTAEKDITKEVTE